MHIGINAQLLSFGQNYRNGGVSRYIRALLVGLAKRPGNHEYSVFVNGQGVIEQLAARHPQITYIPAPWPESRPAARVAWEQLTLPSLLRQRGIDVLHSPVNVLPEWAPRDCATVVTLHDLAFLRFPEVLTRAKRLYHRTFTIRSLRRATMVITVSDSTGRDAHELVGIPEERLQTVYLCIDERFSAPVPEEQVSAFREQRGLGDGYILYLGTLEPRKNITTLIDAYMHLRQNYAAREKLVLAGGKGWLYDAIFAKVREYGLESEVIFPGFVADSEQALWYRAASAFVYPSLYEGFGIPVAEALACGTPVVTTNVSSLPEAGAGIALGVDPHDAAALAGALHRAITDPALREKFRSLAPSVAQRFSAATMVEQTIAVYERAAALHALQQRSQRTSFVS
ncbi:MAG TPA: glycosyltransferase family 1 protein [Ktedonobacteraceae bacterium]|jgi:glycosyltransferase involved in cell wall biosynthesis|nr:glycosyltransferase family 1 protein [Ktedonobacteraceae bacterium]